MREDIVSLTVNPKQAITSTETETRFQKMEHLFDSMSSDLNAAVSKLNRDHSITQSAGEVGKRMDFANDQIGDLKRKDIKTAVKLKGLNDQFFYQEVYNTKENLRFFEIPEEANGTESVSEYM